MEILATLAMILVFSLALVRIFTGKSGKCHWGSFSPKNSCRKGGYVPPGPPVPEELYKRTHVFLLDKDQPDAKQSDAQ